MNDAKLSKIELIASCGMNCAICMAYLRDKNNCVGCRGMDKDKSRYCRQCKKKNCPEIKDNNLTYCFECKQFPCKSLKQLDKRYRTKYNMSMIENLEFIRDKGIEEFLKKEEKKWKCKTCNALISCHHGYCYNCESEKISKRSQLKKK